MSDKKRKVLEFICPECGGHNLMEAAYNLTNYSTLIVYSDGETDVSEQNIDWLAARFEYYCKDCRVDFPATTPEEITAWLKEQNALRKTGALGRIY